MKKLAALFEVFVTVTVLAYFAYATFATVLPHEPGVELRHPPVEQAARAEERGVEANALVQVMHGDVHVKALHGPFLSWVRVVGRRRGHPRSSSP